MSEANMRWALEQIRNILADSQWCDGRGWGDVLRSIVSKGLAEDIASDVDSGSWYGPNDGPDGYKP